jgi:tRNA(fMet)-specific endonuclease VapC
MWFLDTNTCIYFLNGTHSSVRDRLLSTPPVDIAIPAIVKAELLVGASKSKQRDVVLEKVNRFLEPFDIVPFSDGATSTYASIRATLESRGNIIGPNDLLIAATVLSYNGILVTNNVREFGRVPDLKIENWVL